MSDTEDQRRDQPHWQRWFDQLRDDFDKESDRAAAILAVSMIENSLEELLRAKLVPSPTAEDPLFDGALAPLSSFSAKIELALRIGLVSDQFARDLHILRKIRNQFAHNISGCNFEDTSTRSRVEQLVRSWHALQLGIPRVALPAGVRHDFLYVAAWILVSIRTDLASTVPFDKGQLEFGFSEDDFPRQRPSDEAPPSPERPLLAKSAGNDGQAA